MHRRRLLCSLGLVALVAVAQHGIGADGSSGGRYRRLTKLRHITAGDGLPHGAVYAIAQDTAGFMWFGTEAGLVRYDGYSFATFAGDPEDEHAISESDVSSMVVDASGVLWVGTWGGGLNRFDPTTETFTAYRADAARPHSLADNRVQAVREDRQGGLWIGTAGGGLCCLDRESGAFTCYRHDPTVGQSLSADRVWAISESVEGELWFGTEQGADLLDRDSGTFRSFRHDPRDPRSLPAENVRAIAFDDRGTLWIGTWRGLGTLDSATGVFRPFAGSSAAAEHLRAVPVNVICEASDGKLWVGTATAGLFSIELGTGAIEQYINHPDQSQSLSNNDVRSIFEDRSGMLWIGTRGGGVNVVDIKPPKLDGMTHYPDDPGSLSSAWWVAAFLEDHTGALWVGTNGGLDRLDRGASSFLHFRHDPSDSGSLASDKIHCLYEDRAGAIWVGTWSGGLARFDRSTESFDAFRHDPADPRSINDDRIVGIAEDGSGMLWVGTMTGLNRFDPRLGMVERQWRVADDAGGASNDFARVLLQDRSGEIWLGAELGGLVRVDRSSDAFTHYLPVQGDPSSLSNRQVLSLYEDSEGILWVGTADGLAATGPERDGFVHYGRDVGLPSTTIYAIVSDARGRVWVSTPQGVSRLDPQSGAVRNFTARDGLQGAFRTGASYRCSDGNLYFGGTAGYTVFYPDAPDNAHVPPVVLSSFLRFDKEVAFDRPLWLVDAITLSHRDNFFSIELAALDYTDPDRNRFRYILEGFDREWHEAGTRRFASYTNVSPGRYMLKVQGCNSDGVWNAKGLQLAIEVVPPFWQMWWFRISAAAGFVGIIGVGFWMTVAAQRKRQRWLKQEVRLRTAELRAANEQISIQNTELTKLSRTDPLTGLDNRRVLEERILLEMAILRRGDGDPHAEPGRGFGIILFDLDDFKEINDTYGHDVGDQVLRVVAERVKESLREVDLAVRFGGDEFVILAHGRGCERFEGLVSRLQRAVAGSRVSHLDGMTPSLTASGGFISYPMTDSDLLSSEEWPRLIEAVDRLMYLSKSRGRARFSTVLRQAGHECVMTERALLRAIIDTVEKPPMGFELLEQVMTREPSAAEDGPSP